MSMQKATPDIAKLNELADRMLERALEQDASLDQQIDVAKTVTTLYLGLSKISAKMETESAGNRMADMRESIRAAGKNGADEANSGR